MSEWPMRGHFRYLRFKTFPTTPRTPQCEVFCPLLLSSEQSGVPEDSNSQLFQVLSFTPHLAKVGLRQTLFAWDRFIKQHNIETSQQNKFIVGPLASKRFKILTFNCVSIFFLFASLSFLESNIINTYDCYISNKQI